MNSHILPRPDFEAQGEDTNDCPWDSGNGSLSDYSSRSAYREDSDNGDLITFSDEEERDGELFTSTLEEFNESSYHESISNFKFWIGQIIRKLHMLYTIAQEDKYVLSRENLSQLNRRTQKIRSLTKLLKKKNSSGNPYFCLLFELDAFFKNCPPSYLTNCSLIVSLKELFTCWLDNSAFRLENYDKLKFFLRRFYEDPTLKTFASSSNRSLEEILKFWKTSPYFSDQNLAKIVESRKFIDNLYFNVLIKQVNRTLKQTAFPLTALVDLGAKNLDFFQNFLKKFSVPMAGPFQNGDPNSPRFLFFVSSVNPADSISNRCVPLYGTFEFRLSAMRDLSHEEVFELWRSLETAPAWIRHFPPMFNLALDPIRNQILAARSLI